MALLLAIETSCDDTAVALMDEDRRLIADLRLNQDLAHKIFGGVVPEIAGRSHAETLLPLIEELLLGTHQSLNNITHIGVTNRPGLVPSLLVGVVTAKSLGLCLDVPVYPINHIIGHILSPQLTYPAWTFPYISLVVSGGHTHLFFVESHRQIHLLGQTVDDAAGEAFDKLAQIAGLGFPGGPEVDRLSQSGNPHSIELPRPLIHENSMRMSFSGLKAAAARFMSINASINIPDLCASYAQAISDVLVSKLDMAAKRVGTKRIAICGGVAANSTLRKSVGDWALSKGYEFVVPELKYCTDNAAMIAHNAISLAREDAEWDLNFGPSPSAYPQDYSRVYLDEETTR